MPLAFIGATLAGALLHLGAFSLPAAETFIALSLVGAGALVLSSRAFSAPLMIALFAFFGLFHGFAYGEAVFGAEQTPIIAYLAGFGLVQYAIAVLSGKLVVSYWGKGADWSVNLPARFAGSMIAGAGVFLAGEHALAAIGFGG